MTQHFTTPPRSLDSRPDYSAPEAETLILASRSVLCSSAKSLEEDPDIDIFA